MPQVPTYQRQVTTQNLPNMRVETTISKEQLGAGEAYTNMTNEALKIAEQAKKDADHAAFKDAQKKMLDFENVFLWGDDKNQGAFTKVGKDSFGLKKQLDEAYGKQFDAVMGTLTNDSQRKLFQDSSQNMKMSMDQSIMRHISAETTKYLDSSSKAYVESETGAAIQNYQDPDRVDKSILGITNETMKFAERKGFGEDQTKNLLKDNLSNVHIGIIDRMIKNKDDVAAKQTYDRVQGQIDPEKKGALEANLQMSSMLGFTQRFVDDVRRRKLSESEALNEARKITDPNKRSAAEKEVVHQYGLEKQAHSNEQTDYFNRITDEFDQSGGKVNMDLLMKLDSEKRMMFKSYQDRNPVLDDTKLAYQLNEKAMNPKTREQFLNYEFIEFKGKLNKENYDKLYNLQTDIKSGKLDTLKNLDGAYKDVELATAMYQGAGFSKKDTEKFGKFKAAFDDAMSNYKKTTNKTFVDNEQVRIIVNGLLKEEIIKRPIFDDKTRRFLMDVKNIDKTEMDTILKHLRAYNLDENDDNILRAWQRLKVLKENEKLKGK